MARVEIYTKDWCPFCGRAVALLDSKGAAFDEYDIDRDSAKRVEMIDRADGRRTVPQIFIGDRHIGGCDELFALERAGRLDSLLEA